MAVNSLSFLFFFLIVFILYYINIGKKQTLWQNCVLLAASYFFYGYADLVMLPLFIVVTIVFYYLGIFIERKLDTKIANSLFVIGVLAGVGLLIYFKYTNFFIKAFTDLLTAVGFRVNVHTFNIIMPLGISFFVFRLLSYIIEIHRGMIPACKDFISFATYVAFFPCMLSGPIDRPDKFIPQLKNSRLFSYELSIDGLRQILWGMFKKMAVADTLATYVDSSLDMDVVNTLSGSTLVFVIIAYTFQIYADFSGYSDMAIGIGKILGIHVAKNFKYPFFATSISDFWHKWHMSLTSWMTDYVYLPLSFSFRSLKKVGICLAIIINFMVVGIWHGANWNYLIYGIYHGLLFVPLVIFGSINTSSDVKVNRFGLPVFTDFIKMFITFICVSFGMIIFRSTNIDIFNSILGRFCHNLISLPDMGMKTMWFLVALMIVIEWVQRKKEFGLDLSEVKNVMIRWSIYFIFIAIIYAFGGGEQHFIYQVF